MEDSFCIVCNRSCEQKAEEIPKTIIDNKILVDTCSRLFKIKEETYDVKFKWKWDGRSDFPNFCDPCGKDIRQLFQSNEEISTAVGLVKNIVTKIKTVILKSFFEKGPHFYKEVTTYAFLKSLSVMDNMYYLQSSIVQDWNPILDFPKYDEEFKTDDYINCRTYADCGFTFLSLEEIDNYFTVTDDDKHQCKMCWSVIKERRNRRRHLNQLHKPEKVRPYQCTICKRVFALKVDCRNHINKFHEMVKTKRKFSRSLIPISPDELRCLICSKLIAESGDDSGVQIPSRNFASLQLSPLFRYNIWTFFQKSSNAHEHLITFCVPCSSLVTDLHSLKLNQDIYQKDFHEMGLKIKTKILLALAENNLQSELHLSSDVSISPQKKDDYFRKLVAKDFSPVVILNYYSKTSFEPDECKAKVTSGNPNSIFRQIKEEELIVLTPALVGDTISLDPGEFEFYFQHVRTEEGDKFTCNVCAAFTKYAAKAIAHCNNVHKNIRRFQCSYCDDQFYYKFDCAFHIVKYHKEDRMEIAAGIERTIKAQYTISDISTDDGVVELNVNPDLRLPKNSVRRVNGKFQCTMCAAYFLNRSSTLVHQKKAHLKIFRFKCEFCTFKNHHKHVVLYHVRKLHPEQQKIIDSKDGGNSTPNIPTFLQQKLNSRFRKRPIPPSLLRGLIVLEEKAHPKAEDHFTIICSLFSCNFCGRRFNLRYKAISHMEAVHFAVRKYQCGACPEKFYNVGRCRKHMRKRHGGYLEMHEVGDLLDKANSTTPWNTNVQMEIPIKPEGQLFEMVNTTIKKEVEEETPFKIATNHESAETTHKLPFPMVNTNLCQDLEDEIPFTSVNNHMELEHYGQEGEIHTSVINNLVDDDSEEELPFTIVNNDLEDDSEDELPFTIIKHHLREEKPEDEIPFFTATPTVKNEIEVNNYSYQEYENEESMDMPMDIPLDVQISVNDSPVTINEHIDHSLESNNNNTFSNTVSNGCENGGGSNHKPENMEEGTAANYSDEDSNEMILGMDARETPKTRMLVYDLIKPGDVIELPKNPNFRKEMEQGFKKEGTGIKCRLCPSFLKNRKIFNQHWGQCHDLSGGYKCRVCHKRDFSRWKCALHFLNFHTVNRKPFICSLCEKSFSCKRGMEKHERSHMGRRDFECSVCALKFISQKTLDTHHVNVHMKIIS